MKAFLSKLKSTSEQYQFYFKNSFLYLFSSIFSATIGILINPFMAKNLSPEDYAIIGYFNSFTLILLPILSFSLTSYYLRNYYQIPDERRQIVSDTILFALLVYGFIALFVFYFLFISYCKISNISVPFYPYALLSFIPVYLNNFFLLYQVNCRIKREATKYAKITVISTLLNTLFSIVLVVLFKYGASGKLIATICASFIVGMYSFLKLRGKFQFEFNVLKDAFKFGWPLSLSAILWYFLSGVDRAMLEKLNDNHTLGIYNVAIQITGYLAIFYTSIAQTFEPDIYKAIAENKKGKLLKIIGGIIVINAIPNILFILLAPFIIGILTYNRYIESSGFAQVLALKNITITFYYSAITVIVGYGFTKSELMIRVTGAILCFLMFKILIAYAGFNGAAWGQVFSFVIMAFIATIFIKWKVN